MKLLISGLLVWIAWRPTPCIDLVRVNAGSISPATVAAYEKTLRFNIYSFTVTSADSGAVRDVAVKAYRGSLLLTNFRVRIDGAVAGVDVGDLDTNRLPELYVYSTSGGSGSFGHVYGWQFLPERIATIQTTSWLTGHDGYMGHDSLWVERDVLCRTFPTYNAGDANAQPTGKTRLVRYRLRPAGESFVLMPDPQTDRSADQ